MLSINKMKFFLMIGLMGLFWTACRPQVEAPPPLPPVPSARQLAWQKLEFYAFIHFNINTFTNKEWGYGDESPELFQPSALDCRQWAAVVKEAGLKGIILTAKHHDGFCLWPSAYTEHSVKNSPWKGGQGDVVRELAQACREYGLKMGLYLSPWDRNRADYGRPEYLTYYRRQLRELLSNYGPIFEVWFDGANGGTGYYGGACEERKIDRRTYYDWPTTFKLVRELQPEAVIFSDAGPDVRWVGNEKGIAGETNWSMINKDEFAPGVADLEILNHGLENGRDWVPAECDVSIRPGWFYHPEEDDQVKTVAELLNIYFKSVGRNASLLLNLPVDRTGRINSHDRRRLQEFRQALDEIFAENLAAGQPVEASSWRGRHSRFAPGNVTDGREETYWCTDDEVTTASLTVRLADQVPVNMILLQEYIALGQRVKKFKIEVWREEKWQPVAEGTTIGYKRILLFPTVKTRRVRLTILASRACPVINNVELYCLPEKYLSLIQP